jgi:hypothetical protein
MSTAKNLLGTVVAFAMQSIVAAQTCTCGLFFLHSFSVRSLPALPSA